MSGVPADAAFLNMTAFILGDLGRPVRFLDYALEWPKFFFSLDAAERAPFMKYAAPVFEQFIKRASDKLATEPDKYNLATVDGEGQRLLCQFGRVALYLLRPDAGLVVPPPPRAVDDELDADANDTPRLRAWYPVSRRDMFPDGA